MYISFSTEKQGDGQLLFLHSDYPSRKSWSVRSLKYLHLRVLKEQTVVLIGNGRRTEKNIQQLHYGRKWPEFASHSIVLFWPQIFPAIVSLQVISTC